MAIQMGLIKFIGTLGDLSFYKSVDQYRARTKGGVTAIRIKNDPSFARTREVNSEFAGAGKAAKIIRHAFRELITKTADVYMTARLVKALVTVIRTDQLNPRGKRNMMDSNVKLLEGFEFNENRKLHEAQQIPFSTTIDRATGSVNISFENFIPNEAIAFPSGATHCKLVAINADIDFKKGSCSIGSSESDAIQLSNKEMISLALHQSLPANSPNPLLVTLGIIFFQEVNTKLYALKDKKNQASTIIKVDINTPTHQHTNTPTHQHVNTLLEVLDLQRSQRIL